jgi:hypothetical protein
MLSLIRLGEFGRSVPSHKQSQRFYKLFPPDNSRYPDRPAVAWFLLTDDYRISAGRARSRRASALRTICRGQPATQCSPRTPNPKSISGVCAAYVYGWEVHLSRCTAARALAGLAGLPLGRLATRS